MRNNATYRSIIRPGHCIYCNGVYYATCADNISIIDGTTIAFWVNISRLNSYIFSKPALPSGQQPSSSLGIYYIASSKQLCIFFTTDAEHYGNFYCPLDGWTFLTVSRNGNNFDVYKNSIHIKHLITQGGDLQDCESGFSVGSRGGSGNSKGYYSEFMWFPSALTTEQIQALYNGEDINESTDVHYNFSEQTGTIIHDSSGNNHSGAVNGAQWTGVTPPWSGTRQERAA